MTFYQEFEIGSMTEDQNIEYKRCWRDEYLKWICAFANAKGGTLFIGIDDNGKVFGVENVKKLLEELPNKIASTMGLVCSVDVIYKNDKAVVKITVNPSSAPVSYHGEFFIRSGATKQVLTGPALTQFIMDKTGTKWDALPVDNVSVEDLDHESFEIFRKNAVSSKRMSEADVNVSNKELLERLELLSEDKLTRAAVLLFHRHPEKWFHSCYTQIGYFLNDADILFQDEVNGSLLLQADRAMELLWLKYFIAPITYKGMIRVDNYPYSRDAVRELFYNSLVHQDFNLGGSVQISVYKDHMYISNIGGVPSGWTAETLLGKHQSVARNNLVAQTFFRAGFIEKWGRGIEKACRHCEEYGNPNPVYTVLPCDIMVRLDAVPESQTFQDDDDLKSAINCLKSNMLERLLRVLDDDKSSLELLSLLGIKERRDLMRRYIHPALKHGYIELTIPDKPTSGLQKYRLTEFGKKIRELAEQQ